MVKESAVFSKSIESQINRLECSKTRCQREEMRYTTDENILLIFNIHQIVYIALDEDERQLEQILITSTKAQIIF